MNKALFDKIVEQILPHMQDPDDRKALIESALHGSIVLNNIDWRDGALTFTRRLIQTLKGFKLESDELAIVALLGEIQKQVGLDQQAEIDELIQELLTERPSEGQDDINPTLPPPSPNPRMQDHVFISYSHDDRSFVDKLAEDLRRRGHILWVDFGGIRGGDVWRQSIADGIHASEIVLVVITPTALQSEWVALEIQTAKDAKKPIIPILVDTLSDSDQQAYDRLGLEAIQYRDFTVGYDEALPELLIDLPQPQAGLPGYCQKLIARLAEAPWGLDHYIQEEAKILPIHASPYDEGLKRHASENLLKRLWSSKRTIVLGEPGMGKTVALERLAWELASNDPPIVPILINLREYDGLPLLNWIRLKLLQGDEQAIRDALQESSDTERFLHEMPFAFYFLLDGLNEVRPKYRETAMQEIRRLSMIYPQHAMTVTSRIQDESWRELRGGAFGTETFVVQEITTQQAQHYLAAHLNHDDADELWSNLDERMQGLTTTPLLLWLIKEAWIEKRGEIPGNRGELYANFIERMLRRDDERKLNEIVSKAQRLTALENLARAMHDDEAVSYSWQQVKAIIPDEQTLTALLVNGLLQGDDIIRFAPHQTVQEHFAARAIQAEAETELNKPKRGFFQRIFSQPEPTIFDTASDPWWAETFIQLAGLTTNPNQLAQKIAETNPWLAWWCVQEGRAVAPETERVIAEQSARLVDSDRVADRRNAVQALLKLPPARVVDQLAKLAIDADASIAEPARQALDELGEVGKLAVAHVFNERIRRFAPPERAEIGRWLGEWGDMRRGVGVRTGLPDIEWVHIPAGDYSYQDGTKPLDYDFLMARYPVTYAQFQTFLDAPDGYNSTKHDDWFEGLAADDDDKQMREQYFKYSNHPRETVNWYQAIAFCRWLSVRYWHSVDVAQFFPAEHIAKLPQEKTYDPMNPATWLVRLPTEFEWEKAARANTGWTYPYADEFDKAKGNTRNTGIGQTSAVGIFPTGDAEHWQTPISDLSGNVWEWCLTEYETPAEHPNGENIRSNSTRVLRGGSWLYDDHYARAVWWGISQPDARYYARGFRVCVPLLR